jgi:hypothetical protein
VQPCEHTRPPIGAVVDPPRQAAICGLLHCGPGRNSTNCRRFKCKSARGKGEESLQKLAATYLIQLQGTSYVAVWPEKSAAAKLIYPFKGWQ